ncbi:hypothetical protein BSL82_02360 [Tardibacter chloracetimidivorans]|uniref:Terminase small subunit n=2 Tax=Tardibacter chloracetimidivorans TaxID=1921510 RepID=A0A1L3ZRR3_9SPHN|nr:hypothetical protein BSL82_02360 [Tardibacter chloracetimidivorans]
MLCEVPDFSGLLLLFFGFRFTAMNCSLSEFVAMPGVPSEPTLRKLIDENPDFPVVSRGKNGQAYEIDAEAGLKWLKARREAEEQARRERQDRLNQLSLNLLGSDAAARPGNSGLSPREISEALQAEVDAIKLAQLRGELVRKVEVEAALSQFMVALRQQLRTMPQRLGKRVEVRREILIALDALIDGDLHLIADRLKRMGAQVPAEEK